MTSFAFDGNLDALQLAVPYGVRKRLHIPGVLAGDNASRLYSHLQEREDWRQVFNTKDKVYELSRDDRRTINPAQLEMLHAGVDARALTHFQYRYETIRVADDAAHRDQSATLIDQFAQFLCSPNTLVWFRTLTGLNGISFADAQATCYRSSDFLTGHDDAVAGKDRLAAYIFSFTPRWRSEWGGLLMFHGGDGHIDEALVPAWNALNIFTVPQMHSVSRIVPQIPFPRYSITGWLRGTPD